MLTKNATRLGDLKQFKITADGTDITSAVMMTNIWQDIYTPGWSAQLNIQDTSNIIHSVGLKQGTKIKITVQTDLPSIYTDGTKEFNFVLYKIDNRIMIKSRHQTYTLHLVSADMVLNQSKRVQKWYNDTPDNIVSNIMSQYIGASVDTISASNKVSVIVPNLSPFTSAQWLSKVSLNAGNADYIFFMNDDKKYSFMPVTTLYDSPNYSSGLKFVQRIADIKDASGSIDKDRILSIKGFHIEHYDGLSNIASGYFGGSTVWYDLINKEWKNKNSTYHSMTGDFGIDTKNNSVSFVPRHDISFSDQPNIFNTSDEWSTSRRRSIMVLNQDKVIIQLPGGGKYWEYIGKTCELELPAHEDQTGEAYDKYYKGKYLISSINHNIDDMVYNVNLVLIKIKLEQDM